MNLLDIVLAIPLIGFLALLLVPRAAEGAIRAIALGFSLVAFVASLGLAFGYETIRPASSLSPTSSGSPRPTFTITSHSTG